MAWNPETYLSFEAERTRPAVELLARLADDRPRCVVDLGCGPGNSTALAVARWPQASVEGIDSSPEMLARARASGVPAQWREADIAAWEPETPVDVLLSNAALQWIADHDRLLPRLMSFLDKAGVLALQVPRNFDDPCHTLIRDVATSGRWAAKLAGVRDWWNVLMPEEYFTILEPHASRIDIWETRYIHVLEGDDAVFRWMSGTGLRPFAAALAGEEREAFLEDYRVRVGRAYPRRASGRTLYPFCRLFVVARR